MMCALGAEVNYALSPQAKGRIERPFRWFQDRIARTCILEGLTTTEEVGSVLGDELHRYNNHQVHFTTKEIPNIRFEKAKAAGNTLFRPFVVPEPYTSPKDVFCLRQTRVVKGYRRFSLQAPQQAMASYALSGSDLGFGVQLTERTDGLHEDWLRATREPC